MIEELDMIALAVDLPAHGLKQGDVGTVVLVHGAEGYEVEFMTLKGETVAVVSLSTDEVRPIGQLDIANARNIAKVGAISKKVV
jgi:hypothetical protein